MVVVKGVAENFMTSMWEGAEWWTAGAKAGAKAGATAGAKERQKGKTRTASDSVGAVTARCNGGGRCEM